MNQIAVLRQIEDLRRQLNEQYRRCPVITPELVELSTRLDDLLNQLNHRSRPKVKWETTAASRLNSPIPGNSCQFSPR